MGDHHAFARNFKSRQLMLVKHLYWDLEGLFDLIGLILNTDRVILRDLRID